MLTELVGMIRGISMRRHRELVRVIVDPHRCQLHLLPLACRLGSLKLTIDQLGYAIVLMHLLLIHSVV